VYECVGVWHVCVLVVFSLLAGSFDCVVHTYECVCMRRTQHPHKHVPTQTHIFTCHTHTHTYTHTHTHTRTHKHTHTHMPYTHTFIHTHTHTNTHAHTQMCLLTIELRGLSCLYIRKIGVNNRRLLIATSW